MKNVTIALDDETHRRARIRAAEMGTSLSALVKAYLIDLAGGAYPAPAAQQALGVRDVQMPFYHDAPAPVASAQSAKGPDGQPFCVNGKWVWTKDGKPRKPGALRHLGSLPDNWDEWPPEMEAYFEKLQAEPWPDDANDWVP